MKPAKTKTTLDSSQRTSGPAGGKDNEVSRELQEKSHQDIDIVLKELETRLDGLSQSEADSRLPGDIIQLAAGDIVPADVRVLLAKDLFLNQSVPTGESLPVEKKAASISEDNPNPLELPNICFMGSNVESGSATAVIVHTGDQTYFGSLAASIVGQRMLTCFDKGINQFTWLMIRFIAVMVPAVFLINGLTKHDWLEAFLFAVAVAVGLTPEMLPMIVTVNLSIVAVGAWLTVSPLAGALGFVALPSQYWLLLATILVCYVILTQVVKAWFIRSLAINWL